MDMVQVEEERLRKEWNDVNLIKAVEDLGISVA